MLDHMLGVIDEIPHAGLFLGVSLGVLALELAALIAGLWTRLRVRSGKGGRSLAGFSRAAGLGILAIPVVAGISLHAARATLIGALTATDPAARFAGVGVAIEAQLNIIPMADDLVILAVLLWSVALALARPAPGGTTALCAGLVGLGLAPLLVGVQQWGDRLAHAFAAVAGVDHDLKVTILGESLDRSRRQLESLAQICPRTIAGFGAVAVLLILLDRRREDPPARSGRGEMLAAGLAIVLAAALHFAARPLRAENELTRPAPPPVEPR